MNTRKEQYIKRRGVMLWLQARGHTSGEQWHKIVIDFYLHETKGALITGGQPVLLAAIFASDNFVTFVRWYNTTFKNQKNKTDGNVNDNNSNSGQQA